MAKLVPTHVVDKNGRSTTVYKKPSGAGPSASLKAAKPVVARPSGNVHVIKGRTLHADSLSLELFAHDEPQQYRLTRCEGEHEWRRSVELSDDELYQYLLMGVDSQDAAALHGLGVRPEGLPDHPDLADHVPGRLGRYEHSRERVANRQVIQRFRDADISALDAEKAIGNKVQDAFLDKALDDQQLCRLFSRKKYSTPHGIKSKANDLVTYSFVVGRLPLSVVDIPSRNLKEINSELAVMLANTFQRVSADKDLFEAMIRKASSMPRPSRIEPLYYAVENHGTAALDLDNPFLCALLTGDAAARFSGGIDSVRYLDTVYALIKTSGRSHGENHPHDWWGGYFTEGISVTNEALEKLRQASRRRKRTTVWSSMDSPLNR
ncbi:hypothetical protein ACX801_08020 [Arthrobacter bambusae]